MAAATDSRVPVHPAPAVARAGQGAAARDRAGMHSNPRAPRLHVYLTLTFSNVFNL